MIKLSILICTIPKRADFFDRLLAQLAKQETDETEVLYNGDPSMSIGAKRNELLQAAEGEYVCFIDDDDRVSDNYVNLLMDGINKSVDVCSLKGVITDDGEHPRIFEHSIKYKAYKTVVDSFYPEVTYERYPNHLNCIKSSIAKQFKFPETNHGEDTDWATQIFKSGLLKTEHYIEDILYFYDYRSKK